MIIAVIGGDLYQVVDAGEQTALVRKLDRGAADIRYVGGQGYVPTEYTYRQAAQIEAITEIEDGEDSEGSNLLIAWKLAQALTDRLEAEKSPEAVSAALYEFYDRKALVDWVHTHSLQRLCVSGENAPKSPHNPAAQPVPVEVWIDTDVFAQRVALQGQSCAG